MYRSQDCSCTEVIEVTGVIEVIGVIDVIGGIGVIDHPYLFWRDLAPCGFANNCLYILTHCYVISCVLALMWVVIVLFHTFRTQT